MRVLAFDCAGPQCAAAIVMDGAIVAWKRIEAARGHAQLLLPLLVGLLEEANVRFGDIDRFAVATGPGSFTGIRVALATAHGLTIGTGKPTIGVTVFEAIAAAAIPAGDSRLLVAIESRRAEIFVQLFDGSARPLTEATMLPPELIAAWAGSGPLTLAGDAAWRVAPHLSGASDSACVQVDPAVIARIAAVRPVGEAPAPFYLRAADAAPRSRP